MRIDVGSVIALTPPLFRRHKLVQALLWVSPASRLQKFRFNGTSDVYGDISDPFIRQYFLSGVFEPEFFEIAGPLLPSRGVFLDVGANVGLCSFGLLGRFPDRDVRCELFEANADLCTLLQRSALLYPSARLQLHHAAVADAPGISRLEKIDGNIGGSFLSSYGTALAPNVVLDDFLDRQGLDTVDLLKLDIEGSEASALRGMERHLRSGCCRAVYTEVSTPNLQRFGIGAKDVVQYLGACGFSVYFCKPTDLRSNADRIGSVRYNTAYGSLELKPVGELAEPVHTDLLAIHATASDGIIHPAPRSRA